MVDNILQVAAFVALGLGVTMLSYRYLAPAIHRTARIMRFRRRLTNFDEVLAHWESAYRAQNIDRGHAIEPEPTQINQQPPADS